MNQRQKAPHTHEQSLGRRQVTSTNVCTMQLKKWSGRFLRHPHAAKHDPIQPRLGNFPDPIEPLQKIGHHDTRPKIFLTISDFYETHRTKLRFHLKI